MSTPAIARPAPGPAAPLVRRLAGRVMAVNSHLVHGPDGVVVVDGQLAVDDATAVRAAVQATGRPLAGVLITHPHPDHYAGAGIIAAGAPILATPEVAAIIARDDALKDEVVGPMIGAQWPADRRVPDHLVDAGSSIELGGLSFRVTQPGPGESHADSLWWLDERTVFTGDVACRGVHAYLADGHHAAWRRTLDALHAELPADAVLHPGHGVPTDRGVLEEQRDYVEAFVAAVGAHRDDDADTRRAEVVRVMRRLVDDERLQFLVELSVEPVHAALVQDARA